MAESVWSFDKWRKEGKIEGRKERKRERNIEIAEKLLKMGLTIEQVVQVTELSKEEVMEIKTLLTTNGDDWV